MAQILASTRQILAADRFVRDGKWVSNALVSMPAVAGVKGAKLGIFGLGAIGCKVAQRAAIFEMDIGYFSRARKRNSPTDICQVLSNWLTGQISCSLLLGQIATIATSLGVI